MASYLQSILPYFSILGSILNKQVVTEALVRLFYVLAYSISSTEAEDLFGKARLRCMPVREHAFHQFDP